MLKILRLALRYIFHYSIWALRPRELCLTAELAYGVLRMLIPLYAPALLIRIQRNQHSQDPVGQFRGQAQLAGPECPDPRKVSHL
jgi:hypothetical protein